MLKQSNLFVDSRIFGTTRVSDTVSLKLKSEGKLGAYRELIGLPATLDASVITAV